MTEPTRPREAVMLEFPLDDGKTRPEFQQDCDVNHIVKKWLSGQAPPPASTTQHYGDFTDVPDYATAHQRVVDAQDAFDKLPSKIRKRFDNNPGQLLAFLEVADNLDEAVQLGLIIDPNTPPAAQDEQPETPQGDEEVTPPEG